MYEIDYKILYWELEKWIRVKISRKELISKEEILNKMFYLEHNYEKYIKAINQLNND